MKTRLDVLCEVHGQQGGTIKEKDMALIASWKEKRRSEKLFQSLP